MEKEFIHLIEQHVGLLYKVCNIYCREQEDKKDLLQEIILQLWKGYPSFKKDAQFTTWMYRVALNTAISNYRKAGRRPQLVMLEEAGWEVPDPSGPGGNEQVTLLYKAIARLNAVEKAMILLHLDGCTYNEIAGITGISNNNVGVKLNRIKAKLERTLKSLEYERT